MIATDGVLSHLRANHDRILRSLVEFASIPSVSTDPAYAADIDRAARWVAAELAAAGPVTVRTLPTAGNPVVYGEWLGAPGKMTVLVYGHYDVQPPDPLEKWDSPAVDANRARRPPLRPRRVRRQGADVDSDRGCRGVLRDGRLPAHQREVHVSKARKRSAAAISTASCSSTRIFSLRMSSCRRTARCGASTSRR